MKQQLKRPIKNKFKRIASVVHLWLGLTTGAIVFIMAITGCIYIFQDELKDVFYGWRFVEPTDAPFAQPSAILSNVEAAYPATAPNMVVFQNHERPASVSIMRDAIPFEVYVNPYSGEIIHVHNMETDFFMVVERLHRFLLLPEEIGKQVTGISTIIFIIMLLSGLVLWWPKKRKNTLQHLKVKWKARWRRKNYDWHRATGFYMILPALLISITGLSFTYDWVHDSFNTLGNIAYAESNPDKLPIFKKSDKVTTDVALNAAMQSTRELMPSSGMFFVWDQGDGLPILTGAYDKSLHFDHQSNFYFDPENGTLLASQYYDAKSPGLQLQEMNYGLHTGQFLRLPGKILALIVSLFIAALPITGFLVWYGRHKKTKKNLLK